jgi:hypothetical protein
MRRAEQAVAVRRRRTRIIVVSWRGLWYGIARFLGLNFRSSCTRPADANESSLVQPEDRVVECPISMEEERELWQFA